MFVELLCVFKLNFHIFTAIFFQLFTVEVSRYYLTFLTNTLLFAAVVGKQAIQDGGPSDLSFTVTRRHHIMFTHVH